jgi:hypothetical protein
MNAGSGDVKKDKSFDVRARCSLLSMTNKEGMEKNGMDKLLKKKVSRRSALKSFGAMGVAPLVLGSGLGEAKEGALQGSSQESARRATAGDSDLHRISTGDMIVEFDKATGTVHSLSAKGDPLATNFLGNRLNVRGAKPLTPAATQDADVPGFCFL